MTTCKIIRDNICAYIDNELNKKQRSDFEKHINNCAECKKDLEEMQKIVELCNDLPQQELPSDFKDELHEKLIAVAKRQEINVLTIKKSRKFRFTKTLASIAAGMLLIFIAGSFYRMGLFTPVKSNESVSESAMQADQQYGVNEDGSDISGFAYNKNIAANGAGGITERSFSSQKAADEGNYEIDRSATIQERMTALSGAEQMKILETASNKLSTVTITTDEPDKLKEEVLALALQNSGEIKDSEEEFYGGSIQKSTAMMPSNAVSFDGAGKAASKTSMYLIIPEIQYEQFMNDINSAFGEANVQKGAFVTEDMTELLNRCIERSNELDNQIKKLQREGGTEDSSEIDAMKKEKEMLDMQIEQMRLGSDYVNVTVIINSK